MLYATGCLLWEPAWVLFCVGLQKNKVSRVVCIADNIFPHEKRPGDDLLTKYFLKSVDAFITMSEKVLGDLRTVENKKPSRFVAHPLYDNFGEQVSRDLAREKIGVSKQDRIALFFGFIRKYKGLDILLDAMKIVKAACEQENLQPIKLVVAGEFYEEQQPYLDRDPAKQYFRCGHPEDRFCSRQRSKILFVRCRRGGSTLQECDPERRNTPCVPF